MVVAWMAVRPNNQLGGSRGGGRASLLGALPRLVAVQRESKIALSVALVLPLGGVGCWGLVD